MQGVAVSATPNGPFKAIRALRPNGLESLDMNLFTDNGQTFLIRACTKNQYLGITKLTPDLTNTAGSIVSVLKAKVGRSKKTAAVAVAAAAAAAAAATSEEVLLWRRSETMLQTMRIPAFLRPCEASFSTKNKR